MRCATGAARDGSRRLSARRRRGLPDRQRVDRRRDVVHAHDARAALHREQRGGDAGGVERRLLRGERSPAPCRRRRAGQRRLARPADQQRHAEREQLFLPRAAARGCAPASCRSRCRGRATMRSRATPAASTAAIRSREEGARPRRRRRHSRSRCCIDARRAAHVHQADAAAPDAPRPPRARPARAARRCR